MEHQNSHGKEFDISDHPHQRFNPLKDEWVLVSPHRALRPWSGQTEKIPEEHVSRHDPKNPLCPGSKRANGQINENYVGTYVFPNDFPALLEDIPEPGVSNDPLFQIAGACGTCRVMCFHPHSDLTLATMDRKDVRSVIDMWAIQNCELGSKYDWVQIFENRGNVMGCSNPHPHCQIWSSKFIPNEVRVKDKTQMLYYEKYNRPMLVDYLQQEIHKKERIVLENSSWGVVVPYWAVWPFETMLIPKRHILRIQDLTSQERDDLAEIMQKLLSKYDNMFNTSFPYSMGWHGAPTGDYYTKNNDHWQLHAIYIPPLLRSASIKKFMVGYELLAQPQRDLNPEMAAEKLKNLSDVHYKLTIKNSQ